MMKPQPMALFLLLLLSLSFALSYVQNGENFTVDGGQLNISILGSPPNITTSITDAGNGNIKFSNYFNLPDTNYQFVIGIDANDSVHYPNNKTILLNGKYILDYNDVIVNGFAASFVWNQPRGELRLVKNWNAYGIGVGDLVEVDPIIGYSAATANANAKRCVRDSSGYFYCAWKGTAGIIEASSTNNGSTWTNQTVATSCNGAVSNDVAIVINASGERYVGYTSTVSDNFCFNRTVSGVWQTGSAGGSIANIRQLSMAVDSTANNNIVYATMMSYNFGANWAAVVFYKITNGNTLSGATTIYNTSIANPIPWLFPSIYLDKDNVIIVNAVNYTSTTVSSNLSQYNSSNGGSSWNVTSSASGIGLFNASGISNVGGVQCAIDEKNRHHCLGGRNQTNGMWLYLNSSNNWLGPVLFINNSATSSIYDLTIDSGGIIHAFGIMNAEHLYYLNSSNYLSFNKTYIGAVTTNDYVSTPWSFYPLANNATSFTTYIGYAYSNSTNVLEWQNVTFSAFGAFSFSNTTAVQANDTDTNYAKTRWRSVTTVAAGSGTCTYGMNSTHTSNAVSGTTNITNSSGTLETDNNAAIAGFSWSCETGDYNVSWEVPLVPYLSGVAQNTTATSTLNLTYINETIGIESNLSVENVTFGFTACPTGYQCDRPAAGVDFAAAGTNLLYMNGTGNFSLTKYDFDLNRTDISNSSVQIQYGNATIYADNPVTIAFTGVQYGLGDFRACGGNWTCGVTGGAGTFNIGSNTETTLFMNGSADIMAESNSPVNSTVNISRSYVHESNTTALIHYNLTVNSTTNFSLPAGITWNHTFTGVGHAQSSWANFTLGAFAQSGSRQIAQTEGNISVATARTDYGVIAGFTGTSQNSLYNFTISNFAYTINLASAFDKEFTSNWLYTCTTECPASWGAQWTAIGYDEAISGNLTRQVADGDTGGSVAFMVSSTTGVPAAGGPGGGGGVPFAVFPVANQTVAEAEAAIGAATAAAEDFGQQLTRFLEERIAGIPNYALLIMLFFSLGLSKSYKPSAQPLPFGITSWGVFFFAMFVFMTIAYSKKIGELF